MTKQAVLDILLAPLPEKKPGKTSWQWIRECRQWEANALTALDLFHTDESPEYRTNAVDVIEILCAAARVHNFHLLSGVAESSIGFLKYLDEQALYEVFNSAEYPLFSGVCVPPFLVRSSYETGDDFAHDWEFRADILMHYSSLHSFDLKVLYPFLIKCFQKGTKIIPSLCDCLAKYDMSIYERSFTVIQGILCSFLESHDSSEIVDEEVFDCIFDIRRVTEAQDSCPV